MTPFSLPPGVVIRCRPLGILLSFIGPGVSALNIWRPPMPSKGRMAMSGYQEILTDPSYCRQIVTLTYPHIGNKLSVLVKGYGGCGEMLRKGASQLKLFSDKGVAARNSPRTGRPSLLMPSHWKVLSLTVSDLDREAVAMWRP